MVRTVRQWQCDTIFFAAAVFFYRVNRREGERVTFVPHSQKVDSKLTCWRRQRTDVTRNKKIMAVVYIAKPKSIKHSPFWDCSSILGRNHFEFEWFAPKSGLQF